MLCGCAELNADRWEHILKRLKELAEEYKADEKAYRVAKIFVKAAEDETCKAGLAQMGIKEIRRYKRLTQCELGARVDRSQAWIWMVENGYKGRLSASHKQAIATALGVEVENIRWEK
jgi:DNA-binding XRE family transcriptional regulator